MQNNYDKTANYVNTGKDVPCSSSDITAEIPNLREQITQYLSRNEKRFEIPAHESKNLEVSNSQQRKQG